MKYLSDKRHFQINIFVLAVVMIAFMLYAFDTSAEVLINQAEKNELCRIFRVGDTGSSIQWFNQHGNDTSPPIEPRTFDEWYELDTIDVLIKKGATTTEPLHVLLFQDNSDQLWSYDIDNSLLTFDLATVTLDFSTTTELMRPSSTFQLLFTGNNNNFYQLGVGRKLFVLPGEDETYYEDGFHVCNLREQGDLTFVLRATPIFKDYWIMPFVKTAQATTSCSFITSGSTTTAACSDAEINNTALNAALGLILFLFVFSMIIFYHKKN